MCVCLSLSLSLCRRLICLLCFHLSVCVRSSVRLSVCSWSVSMSVCLDLSDHLYVSVSVYVSPLFLQSMHLCKNCWSIQLSLSLHVSLSLFLSPFMYLYYSSSLCIYAKTVGLSNCLFLYTSLCPSFCLFLVVHLLSPFPPSSPLPHYEPRHHSSLLH